MELLSPFQYLDINEFYSQFAPIFDFFVFLVMFTGVARIALEKRFEGRGGRAVIIAVGFSLALGLALAESQFGFNLASLGGMAIAILVILFGMILFYILTSAGLPKTTALAWAFILTYTTLNCLSGEITSWLIGNFPIADLVFLIVCLFVVIKSVLYFSSDSMLRKSASSLLQGASGYIKDIPAREEKMQGRGLKNEKSVLHYDKEISTQMLKRLEEIERLIKEQGTNDKGRKAIAAQIEGLSENETKLLQMLRYIRGLDSRLEELDISAIRKLEKEYGEAPREAKARIAEEVQGEKNKFQLSRKMEAIESQIKEKIGGLNLSVRYSTQYLNQHNIPEAQKHIQKAIQYQMAVDRLFGEMEKIINFIEDLTQREFKSMKKEKNRSA